jgi:hypothetical protein
MIIGAGRIPLSASPSRNSAFVNQPCESTAVSWRKGTTV